MRQIEKVGLFFILLSMKIPVDNIISAIASLILFIAGSIIFIVKENSNAS